MLFRLLRFLFGQRTSSPAPQQSSIPAPSSSTSVDLAAGLDASRFAPVSLAEALTATDVPGWQSANFDSRSAIPSANVPRVQLIDRTMVGMGLITEQELVEIHDIGQQMSQFRSDASFIQASGQQAVQQSREERQRLKQQKKAESEQRRLTRQEDVTRRRATDIVFLGRGVSKGLADRRANIEKLHSLELPVMATPADIAIAMGLSISQLRWLAFHSDAPTRTHYINFTVPKKSGGLRRLSCPHAKLASAQQWILANILSRVPIHDAAHGFVVNHSVVTNASQHVNSSVVINADLKDFFPSITFVRVKGLFQRLGYSPAVATILALLCTECPRTTMQLAGTTYHAASGPQALPQGACTSPALSNLIATKLDRRMSAMAAKLGWRYSRYADDLTWSTTGEPSPSIGYVLARIRHIAQDEGFELNHDKTRIQRRSQRQTVTGVVVNDQLNVPRETIRRVRAILHNAQKTGLAAQNKDQHPHFESWLLGMIGWISMVNPTQGEKLKLQFSKLKPG